MNQSSDITYMASEIDKYPIQVTQANFPNTIQLGDVTQIKPNERGMGVDYALDYAPPIDFLCGGSPCQGFSFAGKQLNFNDERSRLFFEFVRIKNECNPKYFLLENVVMKQEYQDVISEQLGVKPIMLNSSMFSAQNRKRLYWTNFPIDCDLENFEESKLVLRDVLQDDHNEPPIPINERNARHHRNVNQKSLCTTATMYKGAGNNGMTIVDRTVEVGHAEQYAHYRHEQAKRVYHMNGKAPTLLTMQGGNREPKVATYSTKGGRIVNRRLDKNGVRKDYQMDLPLTPQLEIRNDDKSNCLTTVQKDNVVVEGMTWRKLTPLECERLQGLPDDYTNHVSKTQRYKMIGNGFSVPTIKHIIKDLPLHEIKTVLSLFDGCSGFQQALHELKTERSIKKDA